MSQQTIDSRALRDALSSFATGVTIVTTVDHDGQPVGMTASSFNSVSMDPPLILWSVTKTALSAPIFKAAEYFSIHVLAANQMALSNKFAKSGADKFEGTKYHASENGVPLLPNVLTRFDCKTWATYEGGDHWIIVGRVEAMESRKGEGLVFSGGSYATAATIQPPNQNLQQDDGPIEDLLIYNLARAYMQVSQNFHKAVEASGLTVPQWRILASLHGANARNISDLVARTFVSPKKMANLLSQMQSEGWLTVSGSGNETTIEGTAKGQAQVEHLFALSAKQESNALKDTGSQGQARLKELLREVIKNTND